MRNLAIMGNIGVGKTTLANYFTTKLGFTRVSFGTAVKKYVADKYQITLEHLESNKSQFRADLQSVGNNMRKQDRNYWVDKLKTSINYNEAPYVIDDCRYQNEATFLRNHELYKGFGKFVIVKLVIDPLTHYQRYVHKHGEDSYNSDYFLDSSETEHHLVIPDLVIDATQSLNEQSAFILGYMYANRQYL